MVRFVGSLQPRYLTWALQTHASCALGNGILRRGRALAPASRVETRTRGPSHQLGAAGKLSGGLLFSTLGRRKFPDLQPRDVDTVLFLAFPRMLAVVRM